MLVLISIILCLIIDLFFSIYRGKLHMTHDLISSIHLLIATIHLKIRGALCSGTCVLYLCCLFVVQGAAERSPLLLCAWCDWRAEQSTRPHHHAGAWLPSGPGHWPLPGTEEWGAPPPISHTQTHRGSRCPELYTSHNTIYTCVLPRRCMLWKWSRWFAKYRAMPPLKPQTGVNTSQHQRTVAHLVSIVSIFFFHSFHT